MARVPCFGIFSVMSTCALMQGTHIFAGLGSINVPHWQHRLKNDNKHKKPSVKVKIQETQVQCHKKCYRFVKRLCSQLTSFLASSYFPPGSTNTPFYFFLSIHPPNELISNPGNASVSHDTSATCCIVVANLSSISPRTLLVRKPDFEFSKRLSTGIRARCRCFQWQHARAGRWYVLPSTNYQLGKSVQAERKESKFTASCLHASSQCHRHHPLSTSKSSPLSKSKNGSQIRNAQCTLHTMKQAQKSCYNISLCISKSSKSSLSRRLLSTALTHYTLTTTGDNTKSC